MADYAFFTGTQLFLLPEGHRSRPSVVRFQVPSGWKIASGLDKTVDPMVFTAPEYDTLVDQPTLMGQFDVTRFTVEGKPHDLVANFRACSRRSRHGGGQFTWTRTLTNAEGIPAMTHFARRLRSEASSG